MPRAKSNGESRFPPPPEFGARLEVIEGYFRGGTHPGVVTDALSVLLGQAAAHGTRRQTWVPEPDASGQLEPGGAVRCTGTQLLVELRIPTRNFPRVQSRSHAAVAHLCD
jgi:hypothetical protein